MKLLKLFPLFALMLFLGSCEENQNEEVEEEMIAEEEDYTDPDEAMTNWTEAWNSNDPQNVQAMTAPDAVVVINGQESPRDSLAGWIQNSATDMRDLRMEPRIKRATDSIAYEAGTFSHGAVSDTSAQFQGSYTIIWERADNENDWEVVLMNISDRSAQDTLSVQNNQNNRNNR